MNIIPVLSSIEEDVDEDEVEAYKYAIAKEAAEYNLQWTDFDLEFAGNFQQILDELELEPIRPLPPFWFQAKNADYV